MTRNLKEGDEVRVDNPVINADEIPDDLAPGTYCCRIDESTTWAGFRYRFVVPPRAHVPGDCLVQIIKADLDTEG